MNQSPRFWQRFLASTWGQLIIVLVVIALVSSSVVLWAIETNKHLTLARSPFRPRLISRQGGLHDGPFGQFSGPVRGIRLKQGESIELLNHTLPLTLKQISPTSVSITLQGETVSLNIGGQHEIRYGSRVCLLVFNDVDAAGEIAAFSFACPESVSPITGY